AWPWGPHESWHHLDGSTPTAVRTAAIAYQEQSGNEKACGEAGLNARFAGAGGAGIGPATCGFGGPIEAVVARRGWSRVPREALREHPLPAVVHLCSSALGAEMGAPASVSFNRLPAPSAAPAWRSRPDARDSVAQHHVWLERPHRLSYEPEDSAST